jgi:phage tail-like protein
MNIYPYTGFHFKVIFEGLGGAANDVSFQSVKGLEIQIETETIKEAGVLDHEHIMPVRAKFSPLTLERGVFKPENSGVITWCKDAMMNFMFQPITVTVVLLNEAHQPLITWNLRHVWPKSWKIKDLNAQQGEVLVETLELNYNAFTVSP